MEIQPIHQETTTMVLDMLNFEKLNNRKYNINKKDTLYRKAEKKHQLRVH